MRLLRRRRRAKKDANHDAICDALTAAYVPWVDTSDVGGGWPDLAARHRVGYVVLLEIKNPEMDRSHQRQTQAERILAETLPVTIVRTAREALEACGVRVAA